MKMNMVFKKKQLILPALLFALCLAIYLNWEYVKVSDGYTASDLLQTAAQPGSDIQSQNAEPVSTYGEAYFAEAKLSRTKSRDEAMDALRYMLEDANLSEEKMAELTLQAAELAKSIEVEGKIENLIKSKGFEDCMVYLEDEKIDVVLRCSELTDSEAAQIKDVILREVALENDQISIIEINS